ncbi:hypothetical protein JX265_013285 [Neoarthrinium moseri]|uniref:Uncharacterized protein n=1 Tax=Neoarthrinium moseri TaxID=1658444 RepID=A0A9P9W8N0_9PEZI|nr:hypothetical protein JX265_013285 [Neoarthrinium moseri]KAI1851846.1 hypothetical protein JX266_002699 [Neoarthrinium moseri]
MCLECLQILQAAGLGTGAAGSLRERLAPPVTGPPQGMTGTVGRRRTDYVGGGTMASAHQPSRRSQFSGKSGVPRLGPALRPTPAGQGLPGLRGVPGPIHHPWEMDPVLP